MPDTRIFAPEYSTDSIWRGNEMTRCLTDDLDAIEADIALLETEKADADHTHNEYALVNHTHGETEHTHDEYALVDHTHTAYALVDHTHNNYASVSDVASLNTLVGDTSVATQISTALASKANTVHTHEISDVNDLSDELDSKYAKPTTGIPKTDLASDIQTSLNKADTAIQSLAGYATEDYVDTKVAGIVDSSPETLNTLNELAAALGDNPNFATTVATQIGGKVDKVDGKELSSNDYTDVEKTKLAGIAEGANNIVVDSALSDTSTNPVQNKVINAAIVNLNNLVGDTVVSTQIANAITNKADVTHTHNYAGSSSAGGAAVSANKLNTNAGGTTQPVYFANGVPVATTYTLGKSVPSNAVFTDTTALGSMTGTLPISKGGTGATTVADARTALGALAKSGDTMSGNLTIFSGGTSSVVLRAPDNSDGDQAYSRIYKNASATADYGLQLRDIAHGGGDTNTSSLLMICDKQVNLADKLQFVRQTNGSNAYYKLYGEHNKPTPSDIGAAASSHTHSYAGASIAGGAATSANKLNTNAGSATQPVYFANGVPVKTTYTLGKSVPANAVFTDTTYSVATTSADGLMSAADKTKMNTISSFNLTKELSTVTISGKCVKIQGLFMITVKLVTTTNIPQWTKLFSVNSAGTMSRDNQRGHNDTNGVVSIQARNNTESGTGLWFQSATTIPAGTYYFDMILM